MGGSWFSAGSLVLGLFVGFAVSLNVFALILLVMRSCKKRTSPQPVASEMQPEELQTPANDDEVDEETTFFDQQRSNDNTLATDQQ
eukprot:NODE_3069_length_425_cov_16.627660_g2557_i0.p1 GENE.NODE_3069_length_425_cov_16.627660_g2557_i0~~NODE_3069_length_425_cov_16.627660_g2557_i0.p1  ORF type:complete len:95 (-),score=25.34 NODE_3069_length_425_cov_16.627660_g2557_i0:141-398(-)